MMCFFHIFQGVKKDGQIKYFLTDKLMRFDQSEEIFLLPLPYLPFSH